MPLLTLTLAVPLIAALVVLALPAGARALIRGVTLAAAGLTLALAVTVFSEFQIGRELFQFQHEVPWITSDVMKISYHVGVDGINVGLILMAALVAFAAVAVSGDIERNPKLFHFLLLVMTGGIIGAFASLDLFFFYFFNELALVPTFIMIGLWGRGPQKNYATFQITLYLTLGAMVALVGLIILAVQSGANTLDIVALKAHLRNNPLSPAAQSVIFPLLLFGFGTLVGLWPFHSWAPLGYGCAPTATAMMHAGVLKKAGLYALIRIALPLMPEGVETWMPVLGWLCLGNILYCGWVAMRQQDLNLLIGNSSLAHMGFVFLGIASTGVIGISGAVLVMIAHGLLAGLSYALTGYLYRQTGGDLDLSRMGGFLKRMPFIGTMIVMCFMAGCGLPGFANFPGEMSVLFGAWKSEWNLHWSVVAAAWGGLVIGAIYMLRAIRRILHGPLTETGARLADPGSFLEKTPYLLLVGALILFGVWPSLLVDRIRPSVVEVVRLAHEHGKAQQAAPATAPVVRPPAVRPRVRAN